MKSNVYLSLLAATYRSSKGETPLVIAAKRGHEQMVRLLLAAGANPRGAPAGRPSAARAAMSRNYHGVARILLGLGPEDELPMCPVCFDVADETLVRCGHRLCVKCAQTCVETWLQSKDETPLRCPHHGCDTAFAEAELDLFCHHPVRRRELDNKRLKVALRSMPDYVSCPHCDAGGIYPSGLEAGPAEPSAAGAATGGAAALEASAAKESSVGPGDVTSGPMLERKVAAVDEGSDAARATAAGSEAGAAVPSASPESECLDLYCPRGHHFCRGCKMGAHPGLSCDEYKTTAVCKDELTKMNGAKPCPGCGSFTYRSGGCSHMTCHRCRKEWCFLCGGDYIGHYVMSGNKCDCANIRARRRKRELGSGDAPAAGLAAAWAGLASGGIPAAPAAADGAASGAGAGAAAMPEP